MSASNYNYLAVNTMTPRCVEIMIVCNFGGWANISLQNRKLCKKPMWCCRAALPALWHLSIDKNNSVVVIQTIGSNNACFKIILATNAPVISQWNHVYCRVYMKR